MKGDLSKISPFNSVSYDRDGGFLMVLESKRRATRALHLAALLVEPVDEIDTH